MSSIWRAAQDGDCARLRALLAEGRDVNARSPLAGDYGMTPLHFAADGREADAMALLLEHGADVDLRSTGNGSAGWTPLHMAAMHTVCPRCIALLLAADADANEKDTFSTSPLMMLALAAWPMEKKIACAELLIQAGARVDDADNDGDTPIWAAVRSGHRKLAKLLLRAGAVIPNHWPRGLSYSEWNQSESARRLVDQVKARGGWREHARAHKRVLVGLVTKCKPGVPDDAAGLVVEFWCPPGGF